LQNDGLGSLATETRAKETLFVSRAGEDEECALEIVRCLEEAGYHVISQPDFANHNFVDRMDDALRSSARVVALLSPAYLESDYCGAEWKNAIAGDPLNKRGRLVVLRVTECLPDGLLAGIVYWDLVPALGNEAKVREIVLDAVARRDAESQTTYKRPPIVPLPSGTVTFLFGEIEDSARRWERDQAGMQKASLRLRELVHAAVAEHKGRVFESNGDAVRAAFARVEDAFAASVAANLAIAAEDFSAVGGLAWRSAIHSGDIALNEGKYTGVAFHRTSQLEAIGNGGQILVSASSAELAGASLGPGTSLVDLGACRLKDLTVAEHVYQLAAPGLASSFQPVHAFNELTNNLPLQPAPLVGRDEVVAVVTALVTLHRLVTLVGTGGIGKTRIALQTAADLLGAEDGGGVWFVDLASLEGEGLVAGAVGALLSLRESTQEPMLQTLVRHLKARPTLLILDNCEHLVAEVAALAETLLAECPKLHILATSRQTLNVAGEQTFRVPPLAVPPRGRALSVAEALEFGSVRWFVERAKLVDQRFSLTEENTTFVVDICRRLDGIALAIELAAARVNVLGAAELARRIEQPLRIVTGGSRGSQPRQKTLRALIDWSFNLLSFSEQVLFRRLAAFTGGSTLDAVEAVCTDAVVPADDILDLISSLVDKSLVVADVSDGTSRYRLLETMAEYAEERLAASGEQMALAASRAAWAADFSETIQRNSWTGSQSDRAGLASREMENVRGALNWALGPQGDLEVAGRIAGGLTLLWQTRALGEGIRYVERILNLGAYTITPATSAALWLSLGAMSPAKRKAECADRAAGLYRQLHDSLGLAHSLRIKCEGLRQMQELAAAEAAADEALQLFQDLRMDRGSLYAAVLRTKASILVDANRNDEARATFDEVLRLLEPGVDEVGLASVSIMLAELEFAAGNISRALTLSEECIHTFARLGDVAKQGMATANAAVYKLKASDLIGAQEAARSALELAIEARAGLYVAIALQHLGSIAALSGDANRGMLLLSYANQRFKVEGFRREVTEQTSYDLGISAAKAALSAHDFSALGESGARLSETQALNEARKI
jgi:predicted ATPase/class 3 adenylate cyclase